jgi:integrase
VPKDKEKRKHKGLYKRGNVWWIRYVGPDGRTRRESSYSSKFKVAQDILVEQKNKVREGNEPLPVKRIKNHSFIELADQYMIWAERQRSFGSKKYFIRELVNQFGNCPLRRFNTMLVEEFQTKTIKAGKSPATANRYLATLKHMFTKAVEWEMVEEEAAKRVQRVKHLEENNRRLRYLSERESQNLIDACNPCLFPKYLKPPNYLMPIVVCALNTGMRKEEILSLQWEKNIDLVHGFILLEITKNGERREIPINQTLRDILQGLTRRLGSPYAFINEEGKRLKEIKRTFHTALRRAGIKDFTFHDLRHTFASQLVMKGADITTVKELLGHKTLAMTLRYAHLAPEHKAKAVGLLDKAQQKRTAQLLHIGSTNGLTPKSQPIVKFGGAEGDRTPDPLNAIQVRSQLRHSPI